MRKFLHLSAFLVAVPLLAAGCGDDPLTPAETGQLQVVTLTSGSTNLSGAYSYRLDDGPAQPIGPNATITSENLPTGNHDLALEGIPANCGVAEGATQRVVVSENQLAVARFTVSCQSTPVAVSLKTAGSALDHDGYSIALDQGAPQAIASDGTFTFQSVSPGRHSVTITGVASNCRSRDSNTVPVEVGSDTAKVLLVIECFSAEISGWDAIAIPPRIMPQGVWASSSSELFIAGRDTTTREGVILHYNGSGWTEQYRGVASSHGLTAVWGASASDVFAVGDEDQLLHYDGRHWGPINQPPSPQTGNEVVWGTSGGNVFTGGWYEDDPPPYMLRRYTGGTWSPVTYPHIGSYGEVYDIGGSSPTDVYLVDEGSPYDSAPEDEFQRFAIVHYDGNTWTTSFESVSYPARPSDQPFYALLGIWDNAPDDVFAVGAQGSILHYDGSVWSPMASPVSAMLTDVWGRSAGDVYAVGPSAIAHYDGAAWSILSDTPNKCPGWRNCIWGTATDVFVLSRDAVLHRRTS
jgi:hypothetical protein